MPKRKAPSASPSTAKTPPAKALKKNNGNVKNNNNKTKKSFGTKQVLASPYAPTFPPPVPHTREKTIEALRSTFKAHFALRATKSEPKTKKQCAKPKGILVGTNEVTRALEKRDVELAIVRRDVKPAILVAHLPALCFVAQARFISIPGITDEIGELFGTKTALAFGIRKGYFTDLIRELECVVCPLNFPWLLQRKSANNGKMNEGVDAKENKEENVLSSSCSVKLKFPAPRMIGHRGKAERQVVEWEGEVDGETEMTAEGKRIR